MCPNPLWLILQFTTTNKQTIQLSTPFTTLGLQRDNRRVCERRGLSVLAPCGGGRRAEVPSSVLQDISVCVRDRREGVLREERSSLRVRTRTSRSETACVRCTRAPDHGTRRKRRYCHNVVYFSSLLINFLVFQLLLTGVHIGSLVFEMNILQILTWVSWRGLFVENGKNCEKEEIGLSKYTKLCCNCLVIILVQSLYTL